MRIRLALLCAVAITAGTGMDASGSPPELVPPPQGKDVTVKVMRGGRVTIPLEAFTRNMSRVVFGIDPKRQPKFGRLGAIRPKDGKLNQATVVYTHGDDEKSTTDEFYFTVQRTSGGGTGRSKVTIRILDPSPVLAAPAAIDFGEVVVGEMPVRTLSLANVGGGRLPIDLKIPQPFSLETSGFFQLGRGKGSDVAISFRPRTVGDFVSYIQPSPSEPGTKITLRGRALAPIEANAASDTLAPAPDDSRSTTIDILNNAAYTTEVRLTLPSDVPLNALDAGERVSIIRVGPAESKTLTLRIPPENKSAYDSIPVIFSVADAQDRSSDYTMQLELSAPAIPPHIGFISEPDFGAIEEGHAAQAWLVATNSGGVASDIRIKTQPPVRIVERQETFTIPAGGSVAIELSAKLKKGETLPPHIPVEVGGKITNLPVHSGSIVARATNEPPPSATPPHPPASPVPQAVNGWALNSPQGISIDPGQPPNTLRWVPSKPDWKDPELEIYVSAYGLWLRYEPARPPAPAFWSKVLAIPGDVIAWFKSGFGGIDKSLNDRNNLDRVTGEKAEEPKDERLLTIATQEANNASLWRLTAVSEESGAREPASECFRLDSNAKTLIAAEPPQPPIPAINPAAPPELKIKGARAKSERRRAFVAIIVPYDTSANSGPQASDYQLEQVGLQYTPAGMQVRTVDTKQTGSFAKTAEVVRSAETNLVEVRAIIEGLAPGTRTFWRLKQLRPNGDPLVSGEISVATEPPWEIPWRGLVIGISFAALAVILYLRHRRSRAD